MALHGLRGTVISRLFEAGHGDAAMALRSGHRDHRSFASYKTLRGRLRAIQREDILGVSSDKSSSSNAFDSAKQVAEKLHPHKQIAHQEVL